MSQITIGGSIGTTGVSILGNYNVVFTSDADHTLTATEYTNNFLDITSTVDLTIERNLIAPLVQGQMFVIQNRTMGGQSIQVIGATGSGIVVGDGYTVQVVCDGTNYLTLSGGSGGGGEGEFIASGDLSGNNLAQSVVGIYDHPVSAVPPVNSSVLIWENTVYDVRPLTSDDIQPGFAITGFSGGSTVEVGQTITNPSFTASYTSTPLSAQITNTDGLNSPTALFFPFTSGTVAGAFHHTNATSVAFTLTAVASTTRSANTFINYVPRSFGGIGQPNATAIITASLNNAILSTGDTITNLGLLSSDIGSTFGPFTPTDQVIYLLLLSGSHQFKDAVTGFPFAFNTPTVVSFLNQYGAYIGMYLYQSTNTLTGTFSILVYS